MAGPRLRAGRLHRRNRTLTSLTFDSQKVIRNSEGQRILTIAHLFAER